MSVRVRVTSLRRLIKGADGNSAWAAGFTLLEVLLATAILGIVLAALVGAVVSLARVNKALSERAQVEATVSTVLSSIVQGSADRPGLVSATELLAVGDGQLKFKANDVVYEYVHDTTTRTLMLCIGSSSPIPVLERVEAFNTSRGTVGDRVVVRIELTMRVPRTDGASTWTVAVEGVPRNGVI